MYVHRANETQGCEEKRGQTRELEDGSRDVEACVDWSDELCCYQKSTSKDTHLESRSEQIRQDLLLYYSQLRERKDTPIQCCDQIRGGTPE